MLQDEAEALEVAQIFERRYELIAEIVLRARSLRRVAFIDDVDLERLERAGPLLAQQVQGGVDRDPVYPGLQARVAMELVTLVPGPEQAVLHRVLRQLGTACDPQTGGIPST